MASVLNAESMFTTQLPQQQYSVIFIKMPCKTLLHLHENSIFACMGIFEGNYVMRIDYILESQLHAPKATRHVKRCDKINGSACGLNII